jgi:decaprenylphospho-beta-D-erythro-pentofuranosid-2-ulose 2-reductase
VIDALGRPRSVAILGGTSDIGLAIAHRLVRAGASRIVLAGRDDGGMRAASESLRREGAIEVSVVHFDAAHPDSHADTVESLFAGGDVDVVVLAFGVLGDQSTIEHDPARAVRLAEVNYVGAVSIGLRVAAELREQGHGAIVVLSSVAGLRARRSNFVYGSSKAGVDAFAQGLGYSLHDSGVRVIVVRPGFVRTQMTAGMDDAPLATSAGVVADAVADALRSRKEIVWVPSTLSPVMTALRVLPRAVFRRLPL